MYLCGNIGRRNSRLMKSGWMMLWQLIWMICMITIADQWIPSLSPPNPHGTKNKVRGHMFCRVKSGSGPCFQNKMVPAGQKVGFCFTKSFLRLATKVCLLTLSLLS